MNIVKYLKESTNAKLIKVELLLLVNDLNTI